MKNPIIILLAFLTLSVNATHNRSAEILYKRVAPFSNGSTEIYTYSITLIKYMDVGSSIADRCVDTLFFGDGTKAAVARVNGAVAGCCANSIPCGQLIVNDPGYKVSKNIYTIIHTYPGPGTYIVSNNDPFRTPNTINIPNSASQIFYVESKIIISALTATNSSPELNQPPTDKGYTGVCFYHNPMATDADGDSLSYDLFACAVSGFSFPDDGPSGYFFINPVTGLLHWCSPVQAGLYSFVIRVHEWRKNTNGTREIIGTVNRDMQVLVSNIVMGLNDMSNADSDVFYPNPFSNQLTINSTGKAIQKAEIYTPDGSLIKVAAPQNGKLEFATGNLPAGIYLLRYSAGSEVVCRKIIKE